MTRRRSFSLSFLSAAWVLPLLAVAACSDNTSPTQPSPAAPAVSAVSLDSATLALGGTARGTVTLTANAPSGGATVTLASSSPSVVRVPATVVVPDGSTVGTFTVSAMTAGSARVTATFGGASRISQTLSVSPLVIALASISLPTTVAGGETLTGTVTLTAPAPSGGVAVLFTSTDPLTVAPSVQVPAGAASTPFSVTTRQVAASSSAP